MVPPFKKGHVKKPPPPPPRSKKDFCCIDVIPKVLDVRSEEGVLADPEVPLGVRVEQVPDPLTVDLHVAHLQTVII